MSLSKWLPCDFEQCHPLLWSGGILVDHWSTITNCWIIVNWTFRNKLQWNLNRNSYIFIQENAFEGVVCETADILSRPQCVNPVCPASIVCVVCQEDNATCLGVWAYNLHNPGCRTGNELLHRAKMAAISQTIFSNTFSSMKSFVFRLKFDRSLFLMVQLIIIVHWFR